MPLKVGPRAGHEGLWITGTVHVAGSEGVRVRRKASSGDRRAANEEAAAITSEVLREAYHGPRRAERPWSEASESYRRFEQRSPGTLALLARLDGHFGRIPLNKIGQAEADQACLVVPKVPIGPATKLRDIITPIRAVMRHAAERGWCDMPHFRAPKQPKGRTPCLMPDQVQALREAAPGIAGLITWYVSTGCRRGETCLLDWADVDLRGGLARLWPDTTKAGKQRLVRLLPAAVEAMEGLPHRSGPVWGAVNVRKRLLTAARKAGVSLRGVHDFRHTWASWHYALHRDLVRLRVEGGWASVGQVETYAHLMPAGHEGAIRQVWGMARIDTETRLMEGNGV